MRSLTNRYDRERYLNEVLGKRSKRQLKRLGLWKDHQEKKRLKACKTAAMSRRKN